MHQISQEALRITGKLNGGYHPLEKVRELLAQLTGTDIHETVTLFPPFYSGFGKASPLARTSLSIRGANSRTRVELSSAMIVSSGITRCSPLSITASTLNPEVDQLARAGVNKFPGDPTDTPSYARMANVKGLHIPPGPGAPHGLYVPPGELVEQFSHASGPGGQGVNTTDSRVQLRIDLGATTALSKEQRELVLARLSTRLSGTMLMITASEHRSQKRNRVAARQRLSALLRESLVPPLVRRPTKPTRGSQRRRMESKRARSEIKQSRRRPNLG